MAKVLLVQSDPSVRSVLGMCLAEASHTVRGCGTALGGLRAVLDEPFDVMVLGLALPDVDGLEMLKMLRTVSDIPVVAVTDRHDERDLVRALDIGADDFLAGPFSGAHLVARMTAVLRRAAAGVVSADVARVGGLVVDTKRREAFLDDVPLDLSRKEFDLLEFLAWRPGVVVPRGELFKRVWLRTHRGERTVDVHLSWLRRKFGESAARPRYLHTVRHVGIKLEAPEPDAATAN
ncbi:response regulator transcription factor [Streptomyces filamentosus]|uniref:response regulator transcription factor n=1 Tax=Streptomyces filamentosus TaxID=67294 RepID=UPI00123B4503|nr:response regulator transcription factor [Streptomyces filamentosus]KAA6216215.1 DNA-binding response regulator [Streptomyces filamentosus]